MNEGTSIAVSNPSDTALMSGTLGAMPLALALYLNDALYSRVKNIAGNMAEAEGFTPEHLLGKPHACFAVVTRAITWRLDPYAVAMATYAPAKGKIGYEGKLVLAILENSGRLDGGLHWEYYGDWSKVQGKFEIRTSDKGSRYAVAKWTDEDARAAGCGIKIIAKLKGEDEPRKLDFDLIQAQPRNSTLWATDPKTQIIYTAGRRFANAVVPALMMGVPFDPVDNAEPIDVTGSGSAEVINMPRAKSAPQEDSSAGDPNAGQSETISGAAETKPAEAETPAKAGTQGAGETKPAADGRPKPDAGTMTVASEAQRGMIVKMAKNAGLTVAQLDEHLLERFGVGVDELPTAVVGKALELVRRLKAA